MKRTLVAFALTLAVVTGGAQAAQAYHTGAQHWGPFMWGGNQQATTRYVYVMDRTSDANTSTALRQYIGAMQRLWATYPGLPYLVWVDQRSQAGACYNNAGNFPGNSMILVCNGAQGGPGSAGYSWWRWDGRNHFVGDANVWISPGYSTGHNYAIACHELGHVIGFTSGGVNGGGHSNNPRSCMYHQVQGPNIGYDGSDVSELLGLYYSHFPG
ncbi:MAG: hypothetical protein M3179_09140 [Actinomycetota bacterium]|nr:hypothetical protein [Actinomycetota bacterium]